MADLRCLGPPSYNVEVNWASTPSGADNDNLSKLLNPVRLHDIPIWHGVRLAPDGSTFHFKISDVRGEHKISLARNRMFCTCSHGERPFACAHMFWLTSRLAQYYVHCQPRLEENELNCVTMSETAMQASIDHSSADHDIIVGPYQILQRLMDGLSDWMMARQQRQRLWIALNPYPCAGDTTTRDMFGIVLDIVLSESSEAFATVDEKLIWNLHFEKTKRWMEAAMETADKIPLERLSVGLKRWERELRQSLMLSMKFGCLSREAIRCILTSYESTVNVLLQLEPQRSAMLWTHLLDGDRQNYYALYTLEMLSRRAQAHPALLEQWRKIINLLVRLFRNNMVRPSTEAQHYAIRARDMLS